METLAYISINLLLFSSWYILLFRKKDSLIFADRLIGTFVAGLIQIIATEMLLGVVFKKLYPAPLFLLNVFISSSVLVPLLVSGGSRGIFSEIKYETIRIFGIVMRDRVLLCISGLFFISVCWLVFLGYLFPSYSWDALWYHLPMVGFIMQSGAIEESSILNFTDLLLNPFPKNMELFFIWNTIFLKNDIIIDLSQLPFVIAGIFSIYSIGIKLRLKEEYAIYSSLLFFFTPIVILQSTTNYIDVAVSAIFLIILNFLMYDVPQNLSENNARPVKDKRLPILFAGLSTGILIGLKGSGPLFVGVLSVTIIAGKFIRYSNPFNFFSSKHERYPIKKSLVPYVLYFIAPAVLTGGYWYIKNWVFYGNPVYPVDISIFDITIFKGVFKGVIDTGADVVNSLSPLSRLPSVWLERIEYYLYDSRLGGFGPIWFILLLPSIVIALFYAIKRKRIDFLFISIVLILTFLLYPNNWNTRYVIFILGLGNLSFGLTLNYFEKRERAIKIIALILVIYTFITANSPCVMPKQVKEFLLLPASERTLSRHKPFNIDIHVRNLYGFWTWIDNNISRGDTLAYTIESKGLYPSDPFFLAPLWNREFSNRVVYVKSDTYNEWLKNLKKNNATYVLIKQNSAEDKWIKMISNYGWLGTFKEKFKVVYADENYKIVRFHKG